MRPCAPARSARADDAEYLGDRGEALARLLEPVVAQPAHALARGDITDLLGAAPLERHRLHLGRNGHHLVQTETAAVAAAVAAPATDGLVALEVDERLEAVRVQNVGRDDRAPLAGRAQQARE